MFTPAHEMYSKTCKVVNFSNIDIVVNGIKEGIEEAASRGCFSVDILVEGMPHIGDSDKLFILNNLYYNGYTALWKNATPERKEHIHIDWSLDLNA